MAAPATPHRESVDVFLQSAGLRPIQAAMFRAWLREHGESVTGHLTHDEWVRLYRTALTTVVMDY